MTDSLLLHLLLTFLWIRIPNFALYFYPFGLCTIQTCYIQTISSSLTRSQIEQEIAGAQTQKSNLSAIQGFNFSPCYSDVEVYSRMCPYIMASLSDGVTDATLFNISNIAYLRKSSNTTLQKYSITSPADKMLLQYQNMYLRCINKMYIYINYYSPPSPPLCPSLQQPSGLLKLTLLKPTLVV